MEPDAASGEFYVTCTTADRPISLQPSFPQSAVFPLNQDGKDVFFSGRTDGRENNDVFYIKTKKKKNSNRRSFFRTTQQEKGNEPWTGAEISMFGILGGC